MSRSLKHLSNTYEENIAFYDKVSGGYNEALQQKESDRFVRQKVKEKLTSVLASGWVLDFGGGTGLDLEWLVAANYNVLFCEPADGMRQQAIRFNGNVLHSGDIHFIDAVHTDFTKWHEHPPFPQKADAVLSNFSAISNIPDIALLFRNLSEVVKPGAHFICLFLDLPFKKKIQYHLRNAIRSFLFRIPFVMYTWHKEYRQTVYVYTVREIRKASAPFFDYKSHEPFPAAGFTLIHLVRK